MEKKTIFKLAVAGVIAILAIVFGSGLIGGKPLTYQLPTPYTARSVNNFSTVDVAMTVQSGQITDCTITSSGDSDLLNDELRAQWAESIVANQTAENDVISGATLVYSAASVKEAANDIMVQAGLKEPEPEPTAEPEPEPEPEPEGPGAESAGDYVDGTYTVEKKTDFSTIDVGITVENGAITKADVSSEGTNDLLTDDHRSAWAAQIVEKQDIDAVSGVTVSSNAVKEAVGELLAQAGGETAADDGEVAELKAALAEAEARAADAEAKVAEAEAKVAALEAAAKAQAQPAEPGPLTDGGYVVEKKTDFSTIWMFISVENGNISSAQIASIGDNDLLTDDTRNAWASQILEKQDVDAVSGVTVSSNAVREGLAELLERAGGTADAAASAEPAEPGPLTDGGYVVEKKTDFSTIWMFISVENGNISSAQIASIGDNDLLTDDTRSAWASQILEKQDVDAVSGVTVSSNAVKEGLAELLERAGGTVAADEKPADAAADEQARLNAVLPAIVTTMGANKDNSYVTDYLEQDPYLVNIYEGYGFAKDYGSARGHEYTLEDVAKTQRPHAKANCLTCKTPDMHKMIEEQGVAVYSMPFDEVMAQMTQNVGCYTCHGADNGNNGALVVTHQYVNEALGENVSTINPATLSCGQCHIEYYFTPEDSEAMMPYHSVAEMTPEAILAYYDAMDFADWTQESTGTRMLKAQHPEMETVLQGKHAAFLSCADCHMPTETTADGVEYRSHFLASPLENEALLASCAKCHGETDMTAFVKDIQQKVTSRETEVGNKLSAMKDALAAAVAAGGKSEEELDAVRKLHREAQWFFDFCYVENSEGAHNSELAMHCLDTADNKIDEALALLGASIGEPAAAMNPEEALTAQPASVGADALRLMRPRPMAQAEAPEAETAETETAEAGAPEAEPLSADALRLMRPGPGAAAAEPEAPAAEAEPAEADAAADAQARLNAVLPAIVTTMGANKDNSYVTDYLEQDPYLVNIYEGYGFAKDYGSARGHEYTLEDVAKTQRPHAKANCLTCKTPDMHKMIEEQGVAVYSMPFDEVMAQMTQNVGCYTCHGADNGNNGALVVTHQYVNEALGENVSTINPATLSCGQCHIEYYFTPEDSEAMMPYHSVAEMTPEAILAYYDAMDFADWTQESTGTRMLKAQHPEMETVLQGKHAAFLSCADCHMPTETTADGVEYRSHFLASPLENEALLASCAKCHGETDMTAFVKDIQQKVTSRETEVGNKLSAMKDALAAAVAAGGKSEEELDAVRKLHREAQWFFDFCYVENSEGAHNSELAMHCLDTADNKIDKALALLGE